MTTAITQTTQTAEAAEVGLGWVGDVLVGGACWSPEEAKAKSVAAAMALVPGLERRPKSFVNQWKRVMWEPANQPVMRAACGVEGISVNTFKAFLMELSSRTSWDGKDPVFTLRKTVAAAMPGRSKITGGAGLRVVDRGMAVAVELGFVTVGFQKKWLKIYDDGVPMWNAGSSVRMLCMPSFGLPAHMVREQHERLRARLRRDEAASKAMAAKKQQAADHRAYVDSLVSRPPDKPPKPVVRKRRSAGMDEALSDARRALE